METLLKIPISPVSKQKRQGLETQVLHEFSELKKKSYHEQVILCDMLTCIWFCMRLLYLNIVVCCFSFWTHKSHAWHRLDQEAQVLTDTQLRADDQSTGFVLYAVVTCGCKHASKIDTTRAHVSELVFSLCKSYELLIKNPT